MMCYYEGTLKGHTEVLLARVDFVVKCMHISVGFQKKKTVP